MSAVTAIAARPIRPVESRNGESEKQAGIHRRRASASCQLKIREKDVDVAPASGAQFFGYAPPPGGAPDGAPDGTLLRVSSTIRLDAAGTAFSSSETTDLLDPAGNVLARICGHREATRLQ